jgi:hypothetical protein
MKNLQNTCHSDLIIYKSYATYILSGTRGKWRLSHHLSNIKSEAQQKKLKTVRGSYTGLDLSIHAKKGPQKSRDTLPLIVVIAVLP